MLIKLTPAATLLPASSEGLNSFPAQMAGKLWWCNRT